MNFKLVKYQMDFKIQSHCLLFEDIWGVNFQNKDMNITTQFCSHRLNYYLQQ